MTNWIRSAILSRMELLALFALLLQGCQADATPSDFEVAAPPEPATLMPAAVMQKSTSASLLSPTPVSPPTLTVVPTATSSPLPLPAATPLDTVTPTPVGACDERWPDDELLALVTLDYGLSRDYKPSDLVSLSDYLPTSVTLGYPTELREIAIEPVVQMIAAMQAAGLRPKVISGFRSYSAQAIAWNKWRDEYPEHASIISAVPGHSEHQLGTTVDFGSPELAGIVGQEDIEFHTYFYKTGEGIWLAEHAHSYGFTLSFPRDSIKLTGLFYEPWHYRYVGVELATELNRRGMSLIQYLLENGPIPCIP